MKLTFFKFVSIVELHSTILLDKSNDTQNSTSFAVRENFKVFTVRQHISNGVGNYAITFDDPARQTASRAMITTAGVTSAAMLLTMSLRNVPMLGMPLNAVPAPPAAINATVANRNNSASSFPTEPMPSAPSSPIMAPNNTSIVPVAGITPGATPATTEINTPSKNR